MAPSKTEAEISVAVKLFGKKLCERILFKYNSPKGKYCSNGNCSQRKLFEKKKIVWRQVILSIFIILGWVKFGSIRLG